MHILDLIPNSDEWYAARKEYAARGYHFASLAPAMMGEDPKLSRSDLVRMTATGDEQEFSQWVKDNLLAEGHRIEAVTRAILEARLGTLKPTVIVDDDNLLFLSLDGLNDKGTGWECKSLNEKLAAMVRAKELSGEYYWQLEHQILGAQLRRVIFTTSDGADRVLSMEYKAVPGRAEKLLAGWRQFDEDVANYKHVEYIPSAVAAPIIALPALSIQVNGSISLIDNLALFGAKLKEFVGNVNKTPDNDQDFADLEQAVKTLKTAEDALEAAESNALAQTASIDEMRRTVAMYKELARTNRLLFDKIVKAEKENIRGRILAEGQDAFKAHILGLNTRLGKSCMPVVPVDFAGAMKGKKTVSSLRDAVSTALANGKIAANEIADRIQINLQLLHETAKDYAFLFVDAAQIVLKANDDFAVLVQARIDKHKADEATRLEQEREKIRAEEVAKIEAQRIADAAKVAPIESVARSPLDSPDAASGAVALLETGPSATDIRSVPPPIAAPWGAEIKRPSDEDICQCVADQWWVTVQVARVWILGVV